MQHIDVERRLLNEMLDRFHADLVAIQEQVNWTANLLHAVAEKLAAAIAQEQKIETQNDRVEKLVEALVAREV